jgi:hypothetical protein
VPTAPIVTTRIAWNLSSLSILPLQMYISV